ncbi:hypothetical protein IV203_025519 [Nitzschia inconspicua]|uniref:Uncharacterized protein n=1 Tax=Nitzschia inconspicua TaxID=303405 RepID=A0A9K3K7Q6_9STRA|nr:hypothetical protein IV203_028313 [Nitzschia inconspicua]KAG7339837.1 hypothetical protein IV203_028298 [Nitzschia inconspicua]KAG7362635.1 hypothetical protein IV203_025519 [Nitzschia inconspicua]
MDDEPWKDFNRMGRRQQLPPLTLWCNIVGKQWLYGKSFRGVVWGEEEEEEEERGGKQSERDGFNYYYPKNIQSLTIGDNDDDVVVADVPNLHIIRSNKQKKMKKNTKGNSTKPHHDLFVYHGMLVYY